jgi:hypothetical protein
MQGSSDDQKMMHCDFAEAPKAPPKEKPALRRWCGEKAEKKTRNAFIQAMLFLSKRRRPIKTEER